MRSGGGGGFLLAIVLGISLAMLLGILTDSQNDIKCGEHSTTVYAHDGKGTDAMIREAAQKLGINPNGLQNVNDATQQARINIDKDGYVSVCFEHGDQRVARLDDVGIRRTLS